MLCTSISQPRASTTAAKTNGLETMSCGPSWPRISAIGSIGRSFARGHLTTCSSGGFEKFELTHYHREQIPYAYRYEKLVPHILKASGGTHIHIGTLSERMLSIIRRGLDELAVSHDRFIHIEYVPNLWRRCSTSASMPMSDRSRWRRQGDHRGHGHRAPAHRSRELPIALRRVQFEVCRRGGLEKQRGTHR